jgi:hypothetical protein
LDFKKFQKKVGRKFGYVNYIVLLCIVIKTQTL